MRQDKVTEAAALARQAITWLEDAQSQWRVICLGVIGEEERQAGRFAGARTYLLEALWEQPRPSGAGAGEWDQAVEYLLARWREPAPGRGPLG